MSDPPNRTAPQRYHLTYELTAHSEGITRAEVPAGKGASDAVIVLSILLPPDGSYSQAIFSLDGKTAKPLDDDDVFKAWALLSKYLTDSPTLSPNRKELVATLWDVYSSAFRKGPAT